MFRVAICIALISFTRVYGDTNYRLNTPIKPSAYFIAVTPYFDTGDDRAFTFDGEVDITFTTANVTSQIKLHSVDLTFNQTNVILNAGNTIIGIVPNGLEFDTNYDFAYINLQNDLVPGTEYSLKITYTGPIREDLNGFYRNWYLENGVKKWLGATQMEPTHARKVFPCFDEPELKAIFTLAIDRPATYKPSLANTKMQSTQVLPNGYVREIFLPTPVMSTYLVAFLVSEFEGVTNVSGTREFGVYARPEAKNQTDYPLDFGLRVVQALGDYFGIDYYSTSPNLKLDHIALPDFRAGAMENWGLIKYRESLFLYVPEDSNPYFKYRVGQIIAHETTHMWFGNLVTCHWWSNTWLNEGFANYFQDYITAMIEPEIGSATMLVTGSVYQAYDADSSPSSPAITNNNVNSPAEISGHFGTITYQKAGSVIRMMHHLIGDEAFRLGLNTYLETNKFNSGYPDKMYDALDFGVRNHSSLAAYPETNLEEVMSSWISQAGHPVLHVDVNYEENKVFLTQKRYYSNSSHSSDEIYYIPITYTTGQSPNFETTKPVFIMKNKTHEFTISNIAQDHSWIIFNIQETGLYRVNYDDHSWQIISSALKGSDRELIHHLNRAKIVNDLFALHYADQVTFDRLSEVLEFLSNETEYSVWYAGVSGLSDMWHVYQGSDALDAVQDYILKILESGLSKLGYEEQATDSFETKRNRMQVLELACKLEHEGCVQNAVNLFKGLRDNGTEITPSLRPVAYCTGLRHGVDSDYDFLWNRMVQTNVASEARVIGDILGCTNDEQKLQRYLVSFLEENSPIRFQDWTVPLQSVLSDYSHLHIVMDHLKQNYTQLTAIYPTMETALSVVAGALRTDGDFAEFEALLTSCTQCSQQDILSARNALQAARSKTQWAKDHKDEILKNLRSNSAVVTPSLLMVAVMAFILGKL